MCSVRRYYNRSSLAGRWIFLFLARGLEGDLLRSAQSELRGIRDVNFGTCGVESDVPRNPAQGAAPAIRGVQSSPRRRRLEWDSRGSNRVAKTGRRERRGGVGFENAAGGDGCRSGIGWLVHETPL